MIFSMRKALTLLELVFVIVILGIVASIGSGIIAQSYESYLIQRAVERASLKSEIAAQQIANMLSYRIYKSTIARNPENLSDWVEVSDNSSYNDTTHTVLEWIGADYDSFSSSAVPGWSGFCDIAASNAPSNIVTPGSNLDFASTVISNTYKDANGSVALFFRHYYAGYGANNIEYHPSCMGLIDTNIQCIHPATLQSSTQLNFTTSFPNRVISEHYKLAVSAFAIWPKQNSFGNYDLYLYYDYQPWNGTRLNDSVRNRVLIRNVTVFKFAEKASTFRLKLCVQEPISNTDANITICKEKAVIL